MATQPQPPVTPSTGGTDAQANTQYGPAPVDQNTPYQQQPVNQQHFAQPQVAPVQGAVTAQPRKGIRGWLLFFTIMFVIAGFSTITNIFISIGNDVNIANLLFGLIFAGLSIAAAVTITIEKKIGRWLAIAAWACRIVQTIFDLIFNFDITVEASNNNLSVPLLIFGIVFAMALLALPLLYFLTSRQVKETLIK